MTSSLNYPDLQSTFHKVIQAWEHPIDRRYFLTVEAGHHRDLIRYFMDQSDTMWLSTITAVDLGNAVQLNYHVSPGDDLITLRVNVPNKQLAIETITDIVPGARYYEQEIHDLFGVKFVGHPDLSRFLLPDSWPANSFPLRKDWNPDDLTQCTVVTPPSVDPVPKETVESFIRIVVGPQHPALHEPERFLFKVDGERVMSVESRIGYVHRGIEKALEKMSFLQGIHVVERICGICNMAHTNCFCSAVETIAGVHLSPKAKYLRMIVTELNRLHSHLLLLGVAGFELGFESLFQFVWRDREHVLDLIELITGNRIMSEFNTFGGVRRDITPTQVEKCVKTLEKLDPQLRFYQEFFASDSTFHLRTEHIGVITRSQAKALCVVGPVARASGVPVDIRRTDPCSAHADIPFSMVTYKEGDSLARFRVRVDETVESAHIIKEALTRLPQGPYRVRVPRRIPEGEDIARIEAPRGELIHYVRSNGTDRPERVKVRSPTLANLAAFGPSVKDSYIADIPAILISLDPCFSCTDRMGFVDLASGKRWQWKPQDIRRHYYPR